MPYDSQLERSDVEARVPEEVASEVIKGATSQSAVLTLARRVPISSKTQRLPVLSVLPIAYFVDGDTGLKQTTKAEWDKVFLNVEDIAVILPVPENVIEDTDFDIWGELRPLMEEAVGRVLDAAVLFGQNKPASWPDSIVTGANAAGNDVAIGTNAAAAGGVAEDINDVMALVEADGYNVTGFTAPRRFRSVLRGARDTSGQKLLDVSTEQIEGVPVVYSAPGLWPASRHLIAGDWTKAVIGVRRDMTYKLLTEAVITDDAGAIVYNLPQQDMVAMRLVFRVAYALAKPYTHEAQLTGFPFALLSASGS